MRKSAMILFTTLGLLLQNSLVYSQNCPGGNCAAPNQYNNDNGNANSSCSNGSCSNGSCSNGSCSNGNCSNGSCSNGNCSNGSCSYGSASYGGGYNPEQTNCNACNLEYNCHINQSRECSKCKGYPLPLELQRRNVAPLTPAPDLL